jgi:hypothetical protein
MLYLYVHPESGSAWVQDGEHPGDGLCEQICEVAPDKVPKTQHEFEACAREAGMRNPEDYTFGSTILHVNET